MGWLTGKGHAFAGSVESTAGIGVMSNGVTTEPRQAYRMNPTSACKGTSWSIACISAAAFKKRTRTLPAMYQHN